MSEPDTTAGIFGWNELMTTDAKAAAAFYIGVFGWEQETMDMGEFKYHMFKLGDRMVAGMMELTEEMGPVPPHWMSYVNVDDVDAAVAKATQHGGTVLKGAMEIPNTGKLAVIQDPTGAVFSFWQHLGQCN